MSAPLPLDPEERREIRERQRAEAQLADLPFTPVDGPPRMRTGKAARAIPEVRQALIDYCTSHPEQWVRYEPTPEQDTAKASSLGSMVKKQHGGFLPGFEVKIREKIAYLRYVGDAQ